MSSGRVSLRRATSSGICFSLPPSLCGVGGTAGVVGHWAVPPPCALPTFPPPHPPARSAAAPALEASYTAAGLGQGQASGIVLCGRKDQGQALGIVCLWSCKDHGHALGIVFLVVRRPWAGIRGCFFGRANATGRRGRAKTTGRH